MTRNRKPARTARRILKVATLGLAGLVAGLLSGCSSNLAAGFHTAQPLTATRRFENLDYRRTPEIRRAPSLHRHQTIPVQRLVRPAYALVGEIDAVGHHYEPRFIAGQ